MRIKIGRGHHYPWLIPIVFPFWVKKNASSVRKAKFMFTDSCMFDLKDEDQHDVNKLFGFSIGYHHKTSFRFGWRPILDENKIEIVAYEYHDNVRQKTMPICKIFTNEWYEFILSYNHDKARSYYFVEDEGFTNLVRLRGKKHGLGYTLGVYFGGNEKAPQDIIIYKKPA
jgi:hypothetical protein